MRQDKRLDLGSLTSQIEIEWVDKMPDSNSSDAEADTLDDDLDSHVNTFLREVGKTFKLSKMSLETPEDSRLALAKIAELHAQVQKHRQTARALKKLISSNATASQTQALPC